MAINVTGNISNIAVNTTSNVVTVSSSPVNVQLSATSVVSNTSVRQAINVSNLSGFGNLTYDSSNVSNGIIQYTGVSTSDIREQISVVSLAGDGLLSYNNSSGVLNYQGPTAAEVRAHLSAASPVTFNSSTGVIGLEQTLDDLTLKKYQETVVAHGNDSGNITVDVANGTIHTFTLTGNVTKITTPNIATGGSATIILTQDGVGNNILDTTTHPLEWVNWDFVNDFKSLDVTAGNYSILNILWDGTKYYASLVVDSEISPTSLTVSGNIVGGNIDSQGVITSTGNITSSANINAAGGTLTGLLTSNSNITTTANVQGAFLIGDGTGITNLPTLSNAQVKAFIEANGLSGTANLTTTANVSGAFILGDGSQLTNVPQGDITGVTAGSGLTGGGSSGAVTLNVSAGTGITVDSNGVAVELNPFSTSDLSEGTNLYFTDSRATAAVQGAFLGIGVDNNTGSNANTVIFSEGGIGSNTKKLRLSGNTDIIGISTNDSVGLHFVANADANFGTNSNISLSNSSVIKGDGRIDLTGNLTTTANVNAASLTTSANATVGANLNVLGNLEVTGNINYREVEDLLVRDQTITLNFGNASANDVQIISDRSGSGDANTDIKWNETSDKWTFTNDGSTYYNIPTSTSDLAEGTNLYYTNARADARVNAVLPNTGSLSEGTNLYFTGARARGNISVGTPASASSGGALAYNSGTGVFTFTPAVPGIALTNLSVTSLSPNGDGSLAYNPSSGVFTHTPADVPTSTSDLAEGTNLYYTQSRFDAAFLNENTDNLTEGTNLYFTAARSRANISVGTPASASGGGALAYNNSTGVFTFTPADSVTSATNATNATNVNITDDTSTDAPHYVTLSPAASGNQALEVSSSKLSFNPSSGILTTDHISSDNGQPLQLKGQTNGIQVDKTISSVASRIYDADTTGYGVASADLGAFSTNTLCPGFLCGLFITAGGNTGTSYDITGGAGLFAQKEVANNAYTSMFGSSSLQNAVEVGLGTNAKTSGWSQYSLTDASSAAAFPPDTYVVSIVGNTVTFSQNALKSYGAGNFFILAPGAASSTHEDLRFRFSRDTANASLPFQSIEPWMSKYVGPETFANTTLDYASYTISGTTIDAGNVVTRNSIDINSNPDSAIRTQRALLIGANATPDLLSVGTTDVLPGTTTLGITVEQDGQTDFGGANTTPQMKFMMNNYTDNSIGRFTSYPPWTEFLGQSGNATVDLQYLGAPNFNYKLIGGSKNAKVATKTSDVIGRLTFNNVVPGVVSGADIFHPPASLTVRAPGSGAQANNTVANADVHLQSTYSTSFRNGANVAGGTIPRTFLSSSEGNTVIAAKTDGKVTLRPVRDYGDEGADTTYVENRFPHELHEYHEFLGAGFLSSKTGTLVEIQSKSGETGGSSNFNYDSKGNATLRISTHEANNAVKAQWDITNEQSTGNLVIAKGGADLIDITADTAIFTQTIGSPAATDTGAVINFVKPTIFGSPTTAITANITNDLTNAKLGIVQKIYHNNSSEPTFPGTWVKLGETSYVGSVRNIIYCEWCEGTRVEYWYVQEG